jgi:AcrR family transcriptional regulator
MPITPKGRRTRERILAAARVVFAHSGYVTMRMGDVAAEAGVSMGALYRYFQNKEDLFDHLMGDVHEALFEASRAGGHDFARDPYGALLSANRGYLAHYYENRDVMRAFIEVMTIEARFRDIWWRMRVRHIDRFVVAMKNVHGIEAVDGVPMTRLGEAMCSLVEQSAYAWFAQEALNDKAVTVDEAARIVTDIWYRSIFDRPAQPLTEESQIV